MKLKSIVTLILVLGLAFTFSACGNKESEQNMKSNNDGSQNADISDGDLQTYRVLKESITYNPDGSVYQQVKVEQNEDGLPVKATIEGERAGTIAYTYKGKYAITSLDHVKADGDREYYEFNKSGDNLIKDSYKEGVQDSTSEYQYDEGGRLIGKIYREPNNAKADKDIAYEYKLDDQGRIIEELEFVDGKEYFVKEIEYDDQGREKRYSGAYIGREPYIRESEYDDAGNLKKTMEYTGDVEDAYTEYSYDDNGNLLKSITMANGVEDAFEEYIYDEHGNVVKFSYYEKGMGNRHYEYEYDQNNALTKESYYIKGELIRYTVYTWHDQTVRLDKNVAGAIEKVLSIMELK